jgi:hypothetical protein
VCSWMPVILVSHFLVIGNRIPYSLFRAIRHMEFFFNVAAAFIC